MHLLFHQGTLQTNVKHYCVYGIHTLDLTFISISLDSISLASLGRKGELDVLHIFSQLECCFVFVLCLFLPLWQIIGQPCEINLRENKQQSPTTNTVNCLSAFLAGRLLTAGHTGSWHHFSQPLR